MFGKSYTCTQWQNALRNGGLQNEKESPIQTLSVPQHLTCEHTHKTSGTEAPFCHGPPRPRSIRAERHRFKCLLTGGAVGDTGRLETLLNRISLNIYSACRATQTLLFLPSFKRPSLNINLSISQHNVNTIWSQSVFRICLPTRETFIHVCQLKKTQALFQMLVSCPSTYCRL